MGKIFSMILLSVCAFSLSAKEYKASLFGIKSDGSTLNTRSIQKAIDFIGENGGGKLVFYVGRYLTGTIQLKSNVTIQLEEGAILVGTTSVYDYFGVNSVKALITADDQQNIGISGKGVIEGQGISLLEQINLQLKKGYLKETISQASPALIAMNNCSNINIDQLNLQNACGNVVSLSDCHNLSVSGLLIKSTFVIGSKGITLFGCENVKLINLYLETSGQEIFSDPTSKEVTIVNCTNKTGKKF
jgi:polygalacturonase